MAVSLHSGLGSRVNGLNRALLGIFSLSTEVLRSQLNASYSPSEGSSRTEYAETFLIIIKSTNEIFVDQIFSNPTGFNNNFKSFMLKYGPVFRAIYNPMLMMTASKRMYDKVVAENKIKILSLNDQEINQLREQVLSSVDIEGVDYILPDLYSDPILAIHRCSITGRPIRYIVVITETIQDEEPVYYEREQLNIWYSNNPNRRPLAWPYRVSPNRDAAEDYVEAQMLINNQFRALYPQARESFLQPIERT